MDTFLRAIRRSSSFSYPSKQRSSGYFPSCNRSAARRRPGSTLSNALWHSVAFCAITLEQMGFTKYTTQADKERVRMNEGIRAREVRLRSRRREFRDPSCCRGARKSTRDESRPHRDLSQRQSSGLQNNG